MLLSELKIGEKAKIINISDISGSKNDKSDKSIDKQRLSDLGIIEGTRIETLYKSPFGNPVAYFIRGTVFALRNETAEKITVEKI
ncbi:MAG: ferrous iron transport protein A [Oscillospiraceae bacterium]|nr:ferrous iron transport protein A [Oscillospiraceae bacterium]